MEQEGAKTRRVFEDHSGKVIAACLEVHRLMGPGLLESAYEHCLAREFALRGLRFARQVPVPLTYKGIRLEQTFRLDFVIDDSLVLELKAVETLLPVHLAQLISYLKLARLPLGLLVNFHCDVLKQGIRRAINSAASLRAFAPSCSIPNPTRDTR